MRARPDRSYCAAPVKPAGVRRVVCVGDSMVFGQGVKPRESLPAQLETRLNAAAWGEVIEVVNLGRCGNSVFDDWADVQARALRMNPDAVLLVLCENDAELFSVEQDYYAHLDAIWDLAGPTFPHFRRQLETIGRTWPRTGPALVVVFYGVEDVDATRRGSELTGALCRDVNLPFVDLSALFRDEGASRCNTALRVSDVDFHPSAQAHGVAAVGLVPAVLQAMGVAATAVDEPGLYARIAQATDDAVQAGADPATALDNALRLLETKRGARARRRLPAAATMAADTFDARVAALRRLRAAAASTAFLRAYVATLRAEASTYIDRTFTCDARLRAAAKSVHVFGGAPFDRDVAAAVTGAHAHVALALAAIEDGPRQEGTWCCGTAGVLDGHWTEARRAVRELLHDLAGRIALLQTLVETGVRKCACSSPGADLPVPAPEVAVRAAVDAVQELVVSTRVEALAPLADLTRAAFADATTLEVSVVAQFASERPCNLVVQLRAPDAGYPLIEDHRVVVTDGAAHTYVFDLPLAYAGRLRVAINRPGEGFLPGSERAVRGIDLQVGGIRHQVPADELRRLPDGAFEGPAWWFTPATLVRFGAEAAGVDPLRFVRPTRFAIPADAIEPEMGHCAVYKFRTDAARLFAAAHPEFEIVAYEDGRLLPQGHALHDDIRARGGGQYSVWNGAIYFSSTDGSDPGRNGREYALLLPSYVGVLERMPAEAIARLSL